VEAVSPHRTGTPSRLARRWPHSNYTGPTHPRCRAEPGRRVEFVAPSSTLASASRLKTQDSTSSTGVEAARAMVHAYAQVNRWESTQTPTVQYFRSRREGPESVIEDCVARQLPNLFGKYEHTWAAGSVPIGAGMPDLLFVSYEPDVFALARLELKDAHILAYLRAVKRARIPTIAERMNVPNRRITRSLYRLADAHAVSVSDETATLSPSYRDVLPEVVSIEVKVANWQRALDQAKRNRLFCHRSFVALPRDVALRAKSEPAFAGFAVGVLSVAESGDVTVVRRSRRTRPSVWTYYYHLAYLIAKGRGERADIQRPA
jgi:hypothetical protein